jgi:septum formation protein
MQLILASQSPRRAALLGSLGLSFTQSPAPGLDEARLLAAAHGTVQERLIRLAQAKGRPVAEEYPEALVLSADTEVVLDGAFLGKPADGFAAQDMLQRLAGRQHEVCTAVALTSLEGDVDLAACELTRVYFGVLSAAQIDRYIERAEPFDYAGGYAIQGLGALLVERIEGDYSNVVGLPLRLTARLLEQAGLGVL